MKHKWIIITSALLIFLIALTYYLNRVILPNVVKKIAIEQAQNYLNRKVEMESLKFNWLRGIVIHKLKIYQKDSPDQVFVQAEKISTGIIFIPSFQKHKLILPSIHIDSPSMHLIHLADNTWNFSDILAPKQGPPPPVDVSIGGISLENGKIRLDDLSMQEATSQLIEQFNIKVGLGVSGINFDADLLIPQKQSSITLDGHYQLSNQSLNAKITLKNLYLMDFLKFSPIALPLSLTNGIIQHTNAQVEYSPETVKVKGDWSLRNLDLTIEKNHLKADIDSSNADIVLKNNTLALKGSFALNNTQIFTPSLSLNGSIKSTIDEFTFNSADDISAKATINADQLSIQLPGDQSFQGNVSAQISQGRWQKDSGSAQGNILIKNFKVNLDKTSSILGNLDVTNLKARKDKTQTSLEADVSLNSLNMALADKSIKADLKASHLIVQLANSGLIQMTSALDLTNIDASVDKMAVKGNLQLTQLKGSFDPNQQIIEMQSAGNANQLALHLDTQIKFLTNTNFDLKLNYPLKNPEAMQYSGSLSSQQTRVEGLPFGPITNINLKSTFKTNVADIQSLSLSFLETPISASGRIENFTKPLLDIQVESNNIDLSKLQLLAPDLLKAHGLTIDGGTSFKMKFQGPALDPLSGLINAQAVLKNVNIESSTLHQSLKNVSGSFKADGLSLAWEDLTATFMGRILKLTGQLNDFKNPAITTTLLSDGIKLQAQAIKTGDLIAIKNFSGNYLSANFETSGSVDLSGQTPQIEIKNNLRFKLEDLGLYLPDLQKTVDPLKLSGWVNVRTALSGSATDWTQYTIQSNAKCDTSSVAGIKITNINVDLNQSEGFIKKFNVTGNLYDGSMNIVTTANLNLPDMPFETAFHVENVDLSKLKNDTGAKDEDLRGFMATSTMLSGSLKDPINLKGNGAINLVQGYLMKKEFSSIFMISELSNLIFTDASANFKIAQQRVSTENFVLKSQGANLNGKGWVGFDHQLQFELVPEFNTEMIDQSGSLKRGASAIIASAAGKYLTITIDGTLEKPNIRTIKRPVELIKKTGEIITQNVGQILQGIFQ